MTMDDTWLETVCEYFMN